MAEEKVILANSIAWKEHLAVFDKVYAKRLDNIDLTVLLIYLVDMVPASALSSLGKQFDLLGYKGFALATTDEERRTLIKNAIERKRYSGTPWALKEALKSVGYGDSEIIEGLTPLYDGTFRYDGTITHGSNGWAFFSIDNIDLGETKGYKDSDLILLRELIDIYKRAITRLVNLGFALNVSDEIIMKGIVTVKILDIDGEVIEETISENMIVNTGRQNIARLLSGEGTASNRVVNKIGFGTNGDASTESDTELTDSFEKSLSGYTFPDDKSVRFTWTLEYSEANGKNIAELGLIHQSGDLFSRKNRNVIEKTDQLKLEGSWTIIFE